MMHLRRIAAVLSLLLFACAPDSVADEETNLQAGRELLLAAQALRGEPLERADIDGRPVVLTFFASWCPPCTDEFHTLNGLRARFGEDALAIVALNVFERWGGEADPERMRRFLSRTEPAFHVLEGTAEMRAAFGDVKRIPTLIVFDADGNEVWRFVHEVNASKMSATLEEIELVLSPLVQ